MLKKINCNSLVLNTLLVFIVSCSSPSITDSNESQVNKKPNVIIIFADDLGYGDLSCYGHPTIITPNLDKMASEGQKWTNFYVAASVCTPSRAGLITGRYPIRSGMCSNKQRVLFPNSTGGLPADEITIAEQLKKSGYSTAAIGKWHLGHNKQFLPTNNGFDSYFGIPYSNDMNRENAKGLSRKEIFWHPKNEYFDVPILKDEDEVERPADQHTLTKRYNEAAVKYIRENKDNPFFLYLAHNLPHVPLYASSDFIGKSKRGLYGDVLQEIDDGVGKILHALKETGLDENTLVVFTSDNGPWLSYYDHGGSAGLLHDGKGTTWEGGMRIPGIFWWPGRVQPKVVTDIGSTLDLFTTVSNLAGVELPDDRIIDGINMGPVLFGTDGPTRDNIIYYRGSTVFAARKGSYKLHYITQTSYIEDTKKTIHDQPLLYNVDVDPSEKYNIAAEYPDIINEINEMVELHRATVKPVKDQLAERIN